MIALVAGPCKPPRSMQGLGLPYLAAVLEKAGFEVKIFDLYPSSPDTDAPELLDQRLSETIAQERPVLVGMTIHTPFYSERVRLAQYIRERLPHALLVAGGHHPTVEPADLLKDSEFDVCVIGEGEEILLDIAQGLASGNGREFTGWLQEIHGLVYKQGDTVARTPDRPPINNLDSLPFPAHYLLGLQHYAPHPNLGIQCQSIITYRGCPKRCAFCVNPQGRRVRRRSPARVVDEMERVLREFDVRGFNFHDNLFGLHRQHTLAVCDEIIWRGLDIVWDCWTAGNLVDTELALKMKEAGCIWVGFGAESGDDGVLRKARRGFNILQHQAGIRSLKTAGLKVEAFFMVGLPGESRDSIQRTVEFARGCGADRVCLSVHRPYPGTAIWLDPETFGLRIVHGTNYEAYVETEKLSRAAILECAQWANEALKRDGLTQDNFLRCDRYAWEEGKA